jgi:hypothetical protein
MKITITLTAQEEAGIINYLKELDEITDGMGRNEVKAAIQSEIENRICHALRDPREAIADYIGDAEKVSS